MDTICYFIPLSPGIDEKDPSVVMKKLLRWVHVEVTYSSEEAPMKTLTFFCLREAYERWRRLDKISCFEEFAPKSGPKDLEMTDVESPDLERIKSYMFSVEVTTNCAAHFWALSSYPHIADANQLIPLPDGGSDSDTEIDSDCDFFAPSPATGEWIAPISCPSTANEMFRLVHVKVALRASQPPLPQSFFCWREAYERWVRLDPTSCFEECAPVDIPGDQELLAMFRSMGPWEYLARIASYMLSAQVTVTDKEYFGTLIEAMI